MKHLGSPAPLLICSAWVALVFVWLSRPLPMLEPFPALADDAARPLYNPDLAGQVDQGLRDYWQKPDQVLDSLGSLEGLKVADIGCGEGYFTLPLLDRVGAKGLVYATDIQGDILKRLALRIPENVRDRVRLVHTVGDTTGVPEPVDLILMVQVYAEVEDKGSFLDSLKEIMHPGTRLVMIDSKHITDPQNGFTRPINFNSLVDGLKSHGFELDPDYRAEDFDFLPKQFFLILNTKG